MKTKLELVIEGKWPAWSWSYFNLKSPSDFIAGGYCETKKDAENDAAIWLKSNADKYEL